MQAALGVIFLTHIDMPELSQRGLHMPSSPIRKLVPFAEAAKKKRKKNIPSQHRTARY